MASRRTPTHVMLTPVASPADTAPPSTPWHLALRRLWIVSLPVLPVLVDTLIGLYQSGQVRPPSAWVPFVSVALALYQAAVKKRKEDGRLADALLLQASGVPAGISLNAGAVERALNTTATLNPLARQGRPPPAPPRVLDT